MNYSVLSRLGLDSVLKKARAGVQNNPQALRRILNIYPPLRAAGIRIEHISADGLSGRVRLNLKPWTANMNGTAFGGALFSMTDVLYPLLVVQQLGPRYEVWTRSSSFEYLSPGRSGAVLEVQVDPGEIQSLRQRLEDIPALDFSHRSVIKNLDGSVVGVAEHLFHVRVRRRH